MSIGAPVDKVAGDILGPLPRTSDSAIVADNRKIVASLLPMSTIDS
jgi:hypothetical protein